MSKVREVLNYAGCFSETAGSVDRVNGWETVLHDRSFVIACGLGQRKRHTKL